MIEAKARRSLSGSWSSEAPISTGANNGDITVPNCSELVLKLVMFCVRLFAVA